MDKVWFFDNHISQSDHHDNYNSDQAKAGQLGKKSVRSIETTN